MTQESLHSRLRELIEPIASSLGLSIWGIQVPASPKGGILRIYVDSEQGVTIDDCAELSRHVNVILDVEDPMPGPYTLEVSSPGLERPFFAFEQLEPYLGRLLQVQLKAPLLGSKKWKGHVLRLENEELILQTDKQEIHIPWDQVHKARLVYEKD
jgi:ribosome maturation factor RimP